MKHYTRVLARVDLDAVEYNIEMMKKNIQKDTQMMAVIKMDGYGHGAVQIAKLLEPKDYIWGYAVATLDEAILLKDACLKKPVLVLGCIFPDQWDTMYILSLTLEWQDWDSRLQRRMPKKSQRSVNCRTW